MTEALLAALADGGALCVFSSPGREAISLEILDYYRRDLLCCGLNTARLSMYDGAACQLAARHGLRTRGSSRSHGTLGHRQQLETRIARLMHPRRDLDRRLAHCA